LVLRRASRVEFFAASGTSWRNAITAAAALARKMPERKSSELR
jgi:hypothetical protein